MCNKKIFGFTSFIPLITAIVLIITLPACSDSSNNPEEENKDLENVAPEDVGYSSTQLEEARTFAEQSGYAAVMALYDGKVFFEYGKITYNYECHSIRKPFLSALYGIHVAEGNININATLEELGIDDIPPSLTNEEKQAKVKDLLKSRSGVYHAAAAETQGMKDTRPARGSHAPDTYFYYNNWDFNALGTIFEQQTGTKIFEEFKIRIADPIGMQDFAVSNCYYQLEESLSMHRAYSFRMSARDMARFGVLYQQNGHWNGNQIIPQNWLIESTNTYSIIDDATGVGYGYMWYTIPQGSTMKELIGASGFYHTGVGVHVVLVFPDLKLVLVERYDTDGIWTDPGDAGLQLGLMIINSKIQ